MAINPQHAADLARVAPLYERVKTVIPEIEWPVHASYVAAINDLKVAQNAVILAHNYQTPEIFHCVADITGDSLALARRAVDTDADVIVLAGVHFMAETAKLITAEDVRAMRREHPGVPVVTYVNTSAEVKAESDICCTSGNAVEVVESLGTDKVIFIPDEYLASYVAEQTDVEIIPWQGHCEVHERFTADELNNFRSSHVPLTLLARQPKCKTSSQRKGQPRFLWLRNVR